MTFIHRLATAFNGELFIVTAKREKQDYNSHASLVPEEMDLTFMLDHCQPSTRKLTVSCCY